MAKSARLVHERSVGGAMLRAYLVGAAVVVVRGPTEDEYLSEEAATCGSSGSEGKSASELCTYYGVPRESVKVTVTKPEGRHEAGRYDLRDCGIRLVGPTRKMRGKWPKNERQWRDLYLMMTSQVLDAATLPTPKARRKLELSLYKYSKSKRSRKQRRG